MTRYPQRGNQVSHNPTAIELENVDKGRTDAVATESQFEEKKRNETGHEKEERENVQVSETQTEVLVCSWFYYFQFK